MTAPIEQAAPTLVGWLRTQLGEDEKAANRGLSGPTELAWNSSDWHDKQQAARADRDAWLDDQIHSLDCGYKQLEMGSGSCACGGPERKLAEIAAKRAILAEHQPVVAEGVTVCITCGPDENSAFQVRHNNRGWPCRTTTAIAQSYRGRPGWREEWTR